MVQLISLSPKASHFKLSTTTLSALRIQNNSNQSSFDNYAFNYFKYSAIFLSLAWYYSVTCYVMSYESLYRWIFFPHYCWTSFRPASNTSYFASLFEGLNLNLKDRFVALPLGSNSTTSAPLTFEFDDSSIWSNQSEIRSRLGSSNFTSSSSFDHSGVASFVSKVNSAMKSASTCLLIA